MERVKQLPDLALGKRWPHRLLQAMPLSWKRRYLLRQSGGELGCESFDLTGHLRNSRRFLLVWPERGEDLLSAFPALLALRAAIGRDAVYLHLSTSDMTALVADLFPEEQILSWSRKNLAWHEPSLKAVTESARVFSPQTSINLMPSCPSVLKAVVKASGAELRMAVDGRDDWPYVNMRVQWKTDSPLAGHYFQLLNPLRYAGFTVREQWPSLPSDADRRRNAAKTWADSGSLPEQTWLYLHDALDETRPLDDDLYSWLWEKIQMREPEEVAIAMAVLNPPDKPVAREGKWRNVPILKTEGLSGFPSLVSLARGVAAFQGVGLHLSALSDVRCLAFLRREEARYDVSNWNPLFEVEWI
jgi:hypothetical protein